MIIETNTSEYVLIAILSIITKEKEVYQITFHSHTFQNCWTQLWHVQQGAPCYVQSVPYLVPLPKRIGILYKYYHRL